LPLQRVGASLVRDERESVRLLHGDIHEVAPLDTVEKLARSAGWSLAIVPDASHSLPIERPRACAEAIRSQLAAA
jgi:pimeloyl-ACP methyl ester carboxylesterase